MVNRSRFKVFIRPACRQICALVAGLVCPFSQETFGAVQYWDVTTNNGTTVDAGSGNWDLVSANNFWNSSGTMSSWANSSHQAVFAGQGATATLTTTNSGADALPNTYTITINEELSSSNNTALVFNNTGFQIIGNSNNTPLNRSLYLGGVGNTVVTVAAGKSATIGSSAIINFNASNLTGQRTTIGLGATLNIAAGAVYKKTNSSNDGISRGTIGFTGGGTLNISGTVMYDGPANSGGVILANNSGDNLTINLNSGGVLNSNSNLQGILLSSNANTIVLNVSGSISTIGNNPYAGIAMTNSGSAGNATLNLNAGGSISTYAVTPTLNGTNNVGTSTFNFNGGTISPIANHTSFMTGLTSANIKSGGANINTSGFNITIGSSLLNGGGNGGLNKIGAGTLTLTGNLSYTGATTVNTGKLITTKALQNASAVNLNANTVLEIPKNGGATAVTAVQAINWNGSGSRVELHDNDLVIDYGINPTVYSNIINKIKSGLTLLGGAGTDGITSAEVDSQTINGTILAVVDDGDPNIAGGITMLSDYAIPNPSSSILVKYTWFGDANLDGLVDGSDYALTDTGFTSGGTLNGWVFGDYDYNGNIDGADYALIDTGFIAQTAALPEPVMLGLLGLSWIALIRRVNP